MNDLFDVERYWPLARYQSTEKIEWLTHERWFTAEGDKYPFEGAVDFDRIVTTQDASYFGQWCNPLSRTFVCFCEGDITITKCVNNVAYINNMQSIRDFHGEEFLFVNDIRNREKSK